MLDKIRTKITGSDHWTDKQEINTEVDMLIGKILCEELSEHYSDQRILEFINWYFNTHIRNIISRCSH